MVTGVLVTICPVEVVKVDVTPVNGVVTVTALTGEIPVSGVVTAVGDCCEMRPGNVAGICVIVDGTAGGAASANPALTSTSPPLVFTIAVVGTVFTATIVVLVPVTVVTLFTLNCVATGKDVKEKPTNDSPITPTGTFELMITEPTIGAAVTGLPEKISVTNWDSCCRAPSPNVLVAVITPD